ncbi:MAG TPA: isoprenylcysteine carboxylmethyltransferase family protein [Terriglobales bacterium]|nr:isoprenylcysteine carboxylmethyltransferase family protein [Terriglobales bacterium]
MIQALWIIFAVYWVLAAVRQKRRANQDESFLTRLLYAVLALIAFLFLFYYKDSIKVLWILLGLYVAFAILRSSGTKQRQSLFTRLPHIAAMIVAFILVLERQAHFGPLDRRFLPKSQIGTWMGIGVTACGIGLAIWARSYLGANWSATITIRTSHSLVRTGPYARLRHPIYSGLLCAMAGTALAQGEWRGLLALALALLAWSIKARKEECWLREEFGAQFEEYSQRTGFLLPRLTG